MRFFERIVVKIGVCSVVVASGLVAASTPAWADEGNWYEDPGCIYGVACFYRGNIYAAPELSSQYRDSDFSNDYYYEGYGLNDGVKVYLNGFSTLNVQAFLDKNYARPTYCLPPGYSAGPYPIQQTNGLSSFKSC